MTTKSATVDRAKRAVCPLWEDVRAAEALARSLHRSRP